MTLKKIMVLAACLAACAGMAHGQGFNIPSKHWGISFGNSTRFTGLRFNIIEKNIEQIDGVNISVWHSRDFDRSSGRFRGLGIGLPLASGTAYRSGFSVGLFGVAASEDVYGVNIAGLAVGSGGDVVGINLAGLAVGCGGTVKGLNAALLAVGAGNDAFGINIAGVAVGAGEDVSGLNVGGLAAGSGEDMSGISLSLLAVGCGERLAGLSIGGLAVGCGESLEGVSLAGLAVGCGESLTGVSLAGLAVGCGESLKGISLAGLAVGCGDELTGISVAILAVGAPRVKGFQAALVAGGADVSGITVAPAYFRLKDYDGEMVGLSISAFNHISGFQRGVAIGIFNYTYDIKGFQLGLLNHVGSNPKGLRWLPLFNTRF
jgi:hypothetical protein